MLDISTDERIRIAVDKFKDGWTCSQAILCSFNDDFSLNIDTAKALACGFAGGMRCGETCGAVSGAVMVIGLWSAQKENDDATQRRLCFDTVAKFLASCEKRWNGSKCRDILGYDIRDLEERKKFPGQQGKVCPQIIKDSIEILLDCICVRNDSTRNS